MLASVVAEFGQFNWYFLLAAVGLLLLFWQKRGRNVTEKNPIASQSGIPIGYNVVLQHIKHRLDSVRNMHPADYISNMLEGVTYIHRKEKVVKINFGGSNYVMCCEASACEAILKSSKAINKDQVYEIMAHLLGNSLVTSHKEKWQVRRKMLNPAFHSEILKSFFPIFNKHSTILTNKLKKHSGQEIIIDDIVALCTLDIIAETALGVQLNAQENEIIHIIEATNNISSIFMKWFLTPWYWMTWIAYFTPKGRLVKRDLNTMHDFSQMIIEKRKQLFLKEMENSQAIDNVKNDENHVRLNRRIFLDILLYNHIVEKTLGMEDVQEEVDTIIGAGHDTIAKSIGWTLYLLGLHKDIQENLYQEIRSVFGDDKERNVTADDLKEMKYLKCVIQESLRLYPPVPLIGRRTTEDVKAGEYTISANTSVLISIYAIHRDPASFTNPEVFDPDRFLPEGSLTTHQFSYFPFSLGQRNCIGQIFAMIELQIILTNILRNLKLHSPDHRDKIIIAGDAMLCSKHGIRLIVENR